MNREPVVLISGVISTLLGILLAFGIELPAGAEAALNVGAGAVIGIGSAVWAARKVIGRDRPTVVILTGLVPPVIGLLTTLGAHLPPDTVTSLQGFIALVAAVLTRQAVTPTASSAAPGRMLGTG